MWKLLSFFARFYTPGKFIRFIRGTGRRLHFLPKLMTIFYCMQDKDTPKFVKLALMGALGYVILPLDLVSDAFIGIGWLDDAAVVAAACAWPERTSSRSTWKRYAACFPLPTCDDIDNSDTDIRVGIVYFS